MLIERLFIALLLILLAYSAYQIFKRQHARRMNQVVEAAGRSRLLYFHSDNCAPCATQAQFLQQLEPLFAGKVIIQKIDADLEVEKAAGYGIFTLPTTLIVDHNGEVRHVNYGLADSQKLARQLENVI